MSRYFFLSPQTETVLIKQTNKNHHFSLTSVTGNHHFIFCFYEFDNSRYLIKVELQAVILLWLVYFTQSMILQSSSVLYHLSEFRFKAKQYHIICTYHFLFIHSSMNNWVASTFWLLWILLLWIYVYKYLVETLLSILLGIY